MTATQNAKTPAGDEGAPRGDLVARPVDRRQDDASDDGCPGRRRQVERDREHQAREPIRTGNGPERPDHRRGPQIWRGGNERGRELEDIDARATTAGSLLLQCPSALHGPSVKKQVALDVELVAVARPEQERLTCDHRGIGFDPAIAKRGSSEPKNGLLRRPKNNRVRVSDRDEAFNGHAVGRPFPGGRSRPPCNHRATGIDPGRPQALV